MDLLNHMPIRRDGKVSICIRFDPQDQGVIGDATTTPLIDIWNSPQRKEWIQRHIEGKRKDVPLCTKCEFWGVPTGQDLFGSEG